MFLVLKTIKYTFWSTSIGLIFFLLSSFNVYAGEMNMHAIYVNHGDSILIESQGHYMLVDAGYPEYGHLVCDYLDSLEIKDNKIDYVVSTHPDADHCGGFSSVFEKYDIGQVYMSPCTKETTSYNSFLNAIEKEGCSYSVPKDKDSWRLGDATVSVVYDGSKGITYNECSLVLRITCDNKSILLAADLPSTMEKQLLEKGYNFKADILKVAHHGAGSSTSDEFLDNVQPTHAVISMSKENEFSFPKPSVLKRLSKRHIKTYQTWNGNVLLNVKNGIISTKSVEYNSYISLYDAAISLSKTQYVANGNPRKPSVTVLANGITVPKSEYTVKYFSNVRTGTATVKIIGTGNKYFGSTTAHFNILPKKVKLNGYCNFDMIKLYWDYESGATGYKILYSTDKKFKKGVKKVTLKGPEKTSYVFMHMKQPKKFYFMVYSYKENVGAGKISKVLEFKTSEAPVIPKQTITKSVSKKKGELTIKWLEENPSYKSTFKIQLSTDKSFKDKSKTTIYLCENPLKFKKTFKNLTSKKTYYVRVRNSKTYGLGKWSQAVKIKVK